MGHATYIHIERVPCQYCHELRTTSHLLRHEAICYLNPKNIRRCKVCDKPIKTHAGKLTCGHACANRYFRTGINHPNHKIDSKSAHRTICFHHHEHKCVVCGEDKIIDVHHLDGNSDNNSPENLIPLCPTHHKYWHSRFRKLIKKKVLQYVAAWKVQNRV